MIANASILSEVNVEFSEIGANRSEITRYLVLLITCFNRCVNNYVRILRKSQRQCSGWIMWEGR